MSDPLWEFITLHQEIAELEDQLVSECRCREFYRCEGCEKLEKLEARYKLLIHRHAADWARKLNALQNGEGNYVR